ncbi:MAG TPA: hypothetical protein PK358_06545 [Spirochaetota bacterium]|nr:hypothetical protein [Spirochaetota bacterium]
MRDDIAELFDLIQLSQVRKIDLLTDFLNIEYELKNVIPGGDELEITKLLENQSMIIADTDICDYEVSTKLDQIAGLTGIDPRSSYTGKYFKNEKKYSEFINRSKVIEKLIKKINILKSENIQLMEDVAKETKKYCAELDKINKVRNRFAKDLQSS